MSDLEAGSETIRMKRGDIIEAMIEEGLDPEVAKRVFERLTKRAYEVKAMQAQLQAECMKAEMAHMNDEIICNVCGDPLPHDRCDPAKAGDGHIKGPYAARYSAWTR